MLYSLGVRAVLLGRPSIYSAYSASRALVIAGPPGSAKSGLSEASRLSEAAPVIFAELNTVAFDDALPARVRLTWNRRLRRTAGRCHFQMKEGVRTAEIELSPRVLDTRERLRETLAHEMCHAAQWIIDGVCTPPHGVEFQQWARHLERRVPDVTVTVRHSYRIFYRHQYACTVCGESYGRHSRSINLRTRRCGRCSGVLRYEGAFARGDGDGSDVVPVTPKQAPAFAVFVAAEFPALRRRWSRVPHRRIMQELARRYRRRKEPKKSKAR